MNEVNKPLYRLEPPFFEIEENFGKIKLTIYNAMKAWCHCVNIDNGMIGVYNLNTSEYKDYGVEASKFYGLEAEGVRMNYVNCEIKKNDKVLICPFTIYDTKGMVVSILNESKQWYDEQVSKLEAKNLVLGREFKESSPYFKEAGFKITHETIDNVAFFDFLLKKIPLLEVVYSTVEDVEKRIIGLYKVTYLWDKSNIVNDLKLTVFAEYEKLVVEPKMQNILKELKDKNLLPSSKALPPPAEQRGFDLGLTEEQLKALHQQLIDEKFLDKNTKLNHFINAFNGEVLKDFERLEWLKSVFGAIFLKVNFDTDSKKLKVWQNAEKIFYNGNATSLKNADKGTDKHKDYFNELYKIIKSLP